MARKRSEKFEPDSGKTMTLEDLRQLVAATADWAGDTELKAAMTVGGRVKHVELIEQ